MNKPKMFYKNPDGFGIWYESFDPDFIEINARSNVRREWLRYGRVLSGKFKNEIIKPVNLYVENMSQPPKLISIINNTVHLRQENYAEFFLLDDTKTGNFTNVDRPHLRQYYQSKDNFGETPSDCFDGLYKFYVPWFIDADIKIRIEKPEDSPFYIYPALIELKKQSEFAEFCDINFVSFHFKKSGKHMITSTYGKIVLGSPIFDIIFEASDEVIDKIRNFYAKY